MEQTTFDMHIRAGLEYGKDATCGKKIDYKSEETAMKAATGMMKKGSKALEAYPCAFCHGWHIGRMMTAEERTRYMPRTFSLPTDWTDKDPIIIEMCKIDPPILLKDIALAVGLSREAVRNRAKNVLKCYEIRSPILNR